MAILYGTTGDGTTLPVLVDQFGNLLAKGIDGPPGTPGQDGQPGPEGPPGADGGDFPLPPDPYEGAVLGWLNNGLAWISAPPVPIPPGVFGPITGWNSAGVLTVQGDIPLEIANGVYIYQCNIEGLIYVDGWNNSQVWSDLPLTGTVDQAFPIANVFNGSITNYQDGSRATSGSLTLDFSGLSVTVGDITLYVQQAGTANLRVNGVAITQDLGDGVQNYTVSVNGLLNNISWEYAGNNDYNYLLGVEVDGALLVDSGDYPTAPNLNFLVQSVSGQTLTGTANRTDDFTIGKYLRVPEQNLVR
jgi:hypothetical protein